ncbi:MAG: sulfatase-like hydrolase/transferase [Verrucomicrobiota bacterium]
MKQPVLITLILLSSIVVAQASKPNVVLIYIDDLGYGDLACYGATDIPTPNIDQLATEGVRFTTSYITNPPCCPSRCALIMGQYGQRFGKYGMSRGLPIPEDRPTLAKFMADNGYVTGQIGKWDIGSKAQGPLQVGFMEVSRTPPKPNKEGGNKKKGGESKYFCVNENGETMWLTDYDGDLMVDFVERHKDEPFFLYWSPEAVHSSNKEAPDRLKNRTTAKENRKALAGAIVAVDDNVGKLVAALEERGLRENTFIIFSSDNGANGSEGGTSTPYTGGKGGGTQKEGWVRVPTIFSMPGVVPQDMDYDPMIANFDFYSTIAAVAGLDAPSHCDGVNLIPYLTGRNKDLPHEYFYWLNNEPGDAERRHLIAARWKDWRLYKKYTDDEWQLFNLKTDPLEENNVAAAHPEVVRQLARKHAAWEKTLAPLGEIPKTANAETSIPKGHGWALAPAKKQNKTKTGK